MAFSDIYRRQVELLVRMLPYVAEEACFALKGGTAINLFLRNMPRLSVDVDLTYLPVADREESLADIEQGLLRIAGRIKGVDGSVTITESAPRAQTTINKLVIRTKQRVQIKVEVTPVLRGSVYDPEIMAVAEYVEDTFGFAEMKVLPFADLYAGKIMAALDRQHPRDLFDVRLLLSEEGLTDVLRTALIVYLISHEHPPHRLLAPELRDITHDFEHGFNGMTQEEVALDELLDAREFLISAVRSGMPEAHKQFLLSFYSRKPAWELLGLDHLHSLPAVRWREVNLDRAGPGTQAEIVSKLEQVLWSHVTG